MAKRKYKNSGYCDNYPWPEFCYNKMAQKPVLIIHQNVEELFDLNSCPVKESCSMEFINLRKGKLFNV